MVCLSIEYCFVNTKLAAIVLTVFDRRVLFLQKCQNQQYDYTRACVRVYEVKGHVISFIHV